MAYINHPADAREYAEKLVETVEKLDFSIHNAIVKRELPDQLYCSKTFWMPQITVFAGSDFFYVVDQFIEAVREFNPTFGIVSGKSRNENQFSNQWQYASATCGDFIQLYRDEMYQPFEPGQISLGCDHLDEDTRSYDVCVLREPPKRTLLCDGRKIIDRLVQSVKEEPNRIYLR